MARSEIARKNRNKVNSLKQKLKIINEKIVCLKIKKLEKKIIKRANFLREQNIDFLEISVSEEDKTFE